MGGRRDGELDPIVTVTFKPRRRDLQIAVGLLPELALKLDGLFVSRFDPRLRVNALNLFLSHHRLVLLVFLIAALNMRSLV